AVRRGRVRAERAMESFVERRTCEVCGALDAATLCSAPFTDPRVWDFLQQYYAGKIAPADVGDARYEVRRCNACGFLWQAYVLDARGMGRLYEDWIGAEHSLAKKTRADAALFERYAAEAAAISTLLGRPPHEIRVLDFGMGWGFWCRMAAAFGYDVEGFEASEARRAYARGMGVRVVDALGDRPRYDFVHCHHALEHIASPYDTLAALARVLTPGGVIGISVPDGRGVAERLRRPDWRAAKDALHPLEHVNCFEAHTLLSLCRRAGLEPVPAAAARRAPPQPRSRLARCVRTLRAVRRPREPFGSGTSRYFRKPA
ncbi:MAG TPA: class I SAM-dependent methyltransferase, partial [Myxococcota bacterium]